MNGKSLLIQHRINFEQKNVAKTSQRLIKICTNVKSGPKRKLNRYDNDLNIKSAKIIYRGQPSSEAKLGHIFFIIDTIDEARAYNEQYLEQWIKLIQAAKNPDEIVWKIVIATDVKYECNLRIVNEQELLRENIMGVELEPTIIHILQPKRLVITQQEELTFRDLLQILFQAEKIDSLLDYFDDVINPNILQTKLLRSNNTITVLEELLRLSVIRGDTERVKKLLEIKNSMIYLISN